MNNYISVLFSADTKDDIWETDYIIESILPIDKTKISIFVPCFNIKSIGNNFDVFVYNCRKHSFVDILDIVKKIQPKIIIHLSDEYYYENLGIYNSLSDHCQLFLRQHHHPGYEYNENVIQIPLGYCNDAGINNKIIPSISERNYRWSFVGDMKNDRWEMLEQFNKIDNNFVACGIDKSQMMEVYLNSIFVPCGRGNSSLNCFRLYEASMSGCIPVVVGSEKELELTFKYEENPPWIFAETWKDAVEICKTLLDQKDILEIKQQYILTWWKKRIGLVQQKVSNLL